MEVQLNIEDLLPKIYFNSIRADVSKLLFLFLPNETYIPIQMKYIFL